MVVPGDALSVGRTQAGCQGGAQACTRCVRLPSPPPRGLDVRLLQFGRSDWGADICGDGICGAHGAVCLQEY